MTWRLSAGDIDIQFAISDRVRPQPMQKPVSGSTTQILMQGVSIVVWLKESIAIVCSALRHRP
jgi:hypothetical protein